MLSSLGGTPADEDKAREMIRTLKADETAHRIAAAVPFLEHHAESTGKVGAVGFCWGGGMVNRMAVRRPICRPPSPITACSRRPTKVPAIKAALLLHYAGLDKRIDAGIAAYEAALKANDKRFTIYIYPNANHAFNNDTSSRYNKAAAELAWGRTVAFLKEQARLAVAGGASPCFTLAINRAGSDGRANGVESRDQYHCQYRRCARRHRLRRLFCLQGGQAAAHHHRRGLPLPDGLFVLRRHAQRSRDRAVPQR